MKTAIDPKALEEIREIVTGCYDGSLAHNQESFHSSFSDDGDDHERGCQTSHCIAGWKLVKDATKSNIHLSFLSYESNSTRQMINPNCLEILEIRLGYKQEVPWSYAEREWGLTSHEAVILFGENATFEEQFTLIKLLEEGKRITCPTEEINFYYKIKVEVEKEDEEIREVIELVGARPY